MRKNYFIPFILILSIVGFNNNSKAQKQIHPLTPNDISILGLGINSEKNSENKSILCQDTLRYAEMKEAVYGTNNYFWIDLWQADNEAVSMSFLASHNTQITGVEFYARRSTSTGVTNVTVNCGIYSINSNGQPTNLLGNGSINISSTIFDVYTVNFTNPISVTGNYAVVMQPTNPNGIVEIITNDPSPNNSYDETLARYKSSYYLSSNGNWITIPSFNEFVSAPANFEPLLAPIISYTLNTTAIANPAASCIGTPINFTQTTTPAGIQGNRFYNWYSFIDHFSPNAVDSTYKWFLGTGTPEIQSIGSSATNTYSAIGQYNVKVMNYGGFWTICNDSSIVQITITQPTVNAGNDVIACEGETITLNATGANTYNWSNNVVNGQSFTASTVGQSTYQVTGTDINGCINTDEVNVTVNPTVISTITENAIDSFNFNGINLTQSGNYFDTLVNSLGCDSIVVLNLTIGYTSLFANESNNIQIYPNPTTNYLIIQGLEILDIELYDIQGKLLLKSKENKIDLSNLANGIYQIHVRDKNQHVLVEPIIKE